MFHLGELSLRQARAGALLLLLFAGIALLAPATRANAQDPSFQLCVAIADNGDNETIVLAPMIFYSYNADLSDSIQVAIVATEGADPSCETIAMEQDTAHLSQLGTFKLIASEVLINGEAVEEHPHVVEPGDEVLITNTYLPPSGFLVVVKDNPFGQPSDAFDIRLNGEPLAMLAHGESAFSLQPAGEHVVTEVGQGAVGAGYGEPLFSVGTQMGDAYSCGTPGSATGSVIVPDNNQFVLCVHNTPLDLPELDHRLFAPAVVADR